MLKLKPALVDEEGTLVMFPDDVQHGKFVPAKSGMSMYCALHSTAVRTLLNKKGEREMGSMVERLSTQPGCAFVTPQPLETRAIPSFL
jgi:hypothetical protein